MQHLWFVPFLVSASPGSYAARNAFWAFTCHCRRMACTDAFLLLYQLLRHRFLPARRVLPVTILPWFHTDVPTCIPPACHLPATACHWTCCTVQLRFYRSVDLRFSCWLPAAAHVTLPAAEHRSVLPRYRACWILCHRYCTDGRMTCHYRSSPAGAVAFHHHGCAMFADGCLPAAILLPLPAGACHGHH